MNPCGRSSYGGAAGPGRAVATEAALWSGQRGSGHPGGDGLEHYGGRVLPRPELGCEQPAETAAEC